MEFLSWFLLVGFIILSVVFVPIITFRVLKENKRNKALIKQTIYIMLQGGRLAQDNFEFYSENSKIKSKVDKEVKKTREDRERKEKAYQEYLDSLEYK